MTKPKSKENLPQNEIPESGLSKIATQYVCFNFPKPVYELMLKHSCTQNITIEEFTMDCMRYVIDKLRTNDIGFSSSRLYDRK